MIYAAQRARPPYRWTGYASRPFWREAGAIIEHFAPDVIIRGRELHEAKSVQAALWQLKRNDWV